MFCLRSEFGTSWVQNSAGTGDSHLVPNFYPLHPIVCFIFLSNLRANETRKCIFAFIWSCVIEREGEPMHATLNLAIFVSFLVDLHSDFSTHLMCHSNMARKDWCETRILSLTDALPGVRQYCLTIQAWSPICAPKHEQMPFIYAWWRPDLAVRHLASNSTMFLFVLPNPLTTSPSFVLHP